MVFQFPKFILLWGCAIILFSDFALLYLNITVLYTAVDAELHGTSPKILLSTTCLLRDPEKLSCSLFSLPLRCTNPLMWGNVSATKLSFLMPPIRHNQMNSSLSHTLHWILTLLRAYQLVIPLILITMLELIYYYCYYYHGVIGAGATQTH